MWTSRCQNSLDDFLDANDLGVPLTHESAIGSTKLHMVVTVGNGVFLINRHTDAVTCKAGTVLAGYYKGKFESADKPVNGPDVVSFELQGSKDTVLSGGKLTRLGDLVKSKRLTNPGDASISFHELQDAPTSTDPAAFTLKLKPKIHLVFRAVAFPAKSEEGKDGPLNIPTVHLAGAVPSSVWGRCRLASMLWAVKWPPVASKGLQPIRPMVVNLGDIKIPPGKALRLLAPES